MKKKALTYILSVILHLFFLNYTHAQIKKTKGVHYINALIQSNNISKAKTELDIQINLFKYQKRYDSLINYISLSGNSKLSNNNSEAGFKKASQLVEFIKKSNDSYLKKESLLNLAWLYDNASKPKKAYDITKQALEIARTLKDIKKADIEGIEYSLGIRARDFGDMMLSKKHLFVALKIRNKNKDTDFESYYSIYNAVGGVMWYAGKLDSAQYYYSKSLKALEQMDSIPLNKYYRPAMVKNNMSILAHSTGDIDKAIKFCTASINYYNKFIKTTDDASKKDRAKKFSLSSTDNLGAFYNSIGEYNRSDDLVTYSYHEKLKLLDSDAPDILISLIILGQYKISLKDYNAAAAYLTQAINIIKAKPETQLYWSSTAYSCMASVYKEKGNIKEATLFYEKSEVLFRSSLGNDYSKAFLDNILQMASFYSDIGHHNKALKLSEEAYNFVKNSDYQNTLQAFHHVLNLAEVNYSMKNYEKALLYTTEALNLEINNIKKASLNDSISIQLNKPKAILLNAKIRYTTNQQKTTSFLKKLSNDIDKGFQILEQRKSIIKTSEDLNLMLAEHKELFDFSKKINLRLYYNTKDVKYLNKTIQLHESSIYSRIRARLNLRSDVKFSEVPIGILNKEKYLKKNIDASLMDTKNVEKYINATKNWSVFLESLKKNYPKYYNMRYGIIGESLEYLKDRMNPNATVLRYLFIDDVLYVFVLKKESQKLYKLDYQPVKNHIEALQKNQYQLEKTNDLLLELYQKLWQPIANKITTKNVVIIPDGPLYNLSFEILTPTKIQAFKELAKNSLLAKYNISYNYNLYLLEQNKNAAKYKNSFVGFAPGFNDNMKQKYKLSVSDSITLDKNYLTLLQQPFNVYLTKANAKLFNGEYFLNEKATENIFKKYANEHKIIHIGTHAESNNISPELSRLIFAKNITSTNEDGSLYAYEIYNTSLNANLAILTACETGKPSFQAGEGMIALAHAFNYAGSESILTSLWKVDERSTTEIVEQFYRYLDDGRAKDEALRLAKLTYIKTTKGRTLSPQFWAGLVLMGDTKPIVIATATPFWQGLTILVSLLLIVTFILRLKKTKLP